MTGLRAGDGAALEVLVRRHEHAVYAVAARVVGNAPDAADVRQRVFLALLERPPDEPIADLPAYLRRSAANAAVDHVRRRARRRAATRRLAARPRPDADSPDAAPARRDEAAKLRSALAELPPEQRAALALRYDGGLTFAEAAAALGEPASTVKSRTRAAIARLRTLLTAPPPRVRGTRDA